MGPGLLRPLWACLDPATRQLPGGCSGPVEPSSQGFADRRSRASDGPGLCPRRPDLCSEPNVGTFSPVPLCPGALPPHPLPRSAPCPVRPRGGRRSAFLLREWHRAGACLRRCSVIFMSGTGPAPSCSAPTGRLSPESTAVRPRVCLCWFSFSFLLVLRGLPPPPCHEKKLATWMWWVGISSFCPFGVGGRGRGEC